MKFKDHFRITFLYISLIIIDIFIIEKCYKTHYSLKYTNLLVSLFGLEFFLLFLKALLPFIKYLFNIFELFTFSHFEHKLTIFSVFEFVFNSTKLVRKFL